MTLRTLFEKQVFIRLTGDQTAFICTVKRPLLSSATRIGVSGAGRKLAPQAPEQGSLVPEGVSIVGRLRLLDDIVREIEAPGFRDRFGREGGSRYGSDESVWRAGRAREP